MNEEPEDVISIDPDEMADFAVKYAAERGRDISKEDAALVYEAEIEFLIEAGVVRVE